MSFMLVIMHDSLIMHNYSGHTQAALAAMLSLPYAASAAAGETYLLEKSHADLLFSIDHAGFSEKHGSFREFDGTLYYDTTRPEDSWIKVTVKTESLDTALPARDKDVTGDTFLDVARYPQMQFESTKVTPEAGGTLRVEGNLTLHGITRPLALKAKLNKEGQNPFDHKPTLGFSATGSLRRSDFGMTRFLPMIGDIVSITIEVEFNRPTKNAQ